MWTIHCWTAPNPYARRVFRDAHPLDNDTSQTFDDGNGNRIMLAGLGVKAVGEGQHRAAAAGPGVRHARRLTRSAGSTSRSRSTGSRSSRPRSPPGQIRPRTRHRWPRTATRSSRSPRSMWRTCTTTATTHSTAATSPATPAARGSARRSTTCPRRRRTTRHSSARQAQVIIGALHSPDILLIQEAEDQDICTVTAGALTCGAMDNADGKPDTLQELALAISRRQGPGLRRRVRPGRRRRPWDRRGVPVPHRPGEPGTGRHWRAVGDAGRDLPGARARLQRRRGEPEVAQRRPSLRCGQLDRRRRRQRVHAGAAGGEVPRRRDTRLARGADAVGGQQPLLVHAERSGRASGGSRRRTARPSSPRSRRATRTHGSCTAATSTSSPARTTRSPRPTPTRRRTSSRRCTRPDCTTCGRTCSRTRHRRPTRTRSRARRRRSTTSS